MMYQAPAGADMSQAGATQIMMNTQSTQVMPAVLGTSLVRAADGAILISSSVSQGQHGADYHLKAVGSCAAVKGCRAAGISDNVIHTVPLEFGQGPPSQYPFVPASKAPSHSFSPFALWLTVSVCPG